MIICIFLFYQQNHSAKDVLFAIFFNILEHLRTAASGIIRDSSPNSEWRRVEGGNKAPLPNSPVPVSLPVFSL